MNVERPAARIGLLSYPGAQAAAVHGLTDLFEVANRMAAQQGAGALPVLHISHWQTGQDGAPQQVFDSADTGTDGSLTAVLIPPSLDGLPDIEQMQALSDWVLKQHAAGATVGSVCLGAFVLAQTGLLEGRAATTHWTQAGALSERYPGIRVNAEQRIIDEGDIITTAGLMAWSELGLRLVGRLLGAGIACSTARYLGIDYHGSVPACSNPFNPLLTHGDSAVLKTQHWLQSTGAVGASITEMARRAGLEERTFLRRFRAATGLKPTEYCQHLRVGRARDMLEFTQKTVDLIAWTVGYQDASTFRATFRKMTGLSPSEYRNTFGIAAARTALHPAVQ